MPFKNIIIKVTIQNTFLLVPSIHFRCPMTTHPEMCWVEQCLPLSSILLYYSSIICSIHPPIHQPTHAVPLPSFYLFSLTVPFQLCDWCTLLQHCRSRKRMSLILSPQKSLHQEGFWANSFPVGLAFFFELFLFMVESLLIFQPCEAKPLDKC